MQTYHINNAESLFSLLEQCKKFQSLDEKILVIDSLQDVGLEDGIDTNKAALNTMNRIAKFGETGATLIVIHHITVTDDKGAKIKGNATTISSKADTTLMFKRENNIRTTEVMNTRAEDKIATGTTLKYDGINKAVGVKFELPK